MKTKIGKIVSIEKLHDECKSEIKEDLSGITVSEFIKKIKFSLRKGFISKESYILISGGDSEIYIVQNICLPCVILDSNKEFKKVQVLFTDNIK